MNDLERKVLDEVSETIQHTCNIKNLKTSKISYSLFHRTGSQGEVTSKQKTKQSS